MHPSKQFPGRFVDLCMPFMYACLALCHRSFVFPPGGWGNCHFGYVPLGVWGKLLHAAGYCSRVPGGTVCMPSLQPKSNWILLRRPPCCCLLDEGSHGTKWMYNVFETIQTTVERLLSLLTQLLSVLEAVVAMCACTIPRLLFWGDTCIVHVVRCTNICAHSLHTGPPPPGYRPVEIAGYQCYIKGPMRTQGPFYSDGSWLDDGRAGAGITVGDTRIVARVSGEQESYRAEILGLHLISHMTESHQTAKLDNQATTKVAGREESDTNLRVPLADR